MNVLDELKNKAKNVLPNFEEVWARIESRKAEFGENFDVFAAAMLRREIRKVELNPPVERNLLLLGINAINMGAIMRRKYGSVYPEGHFRAGQPIPEEDYLIRIPAVDLQTGKGVLLFGEDPNETNLFGVYGKVKTLNKRGREVILDKSVKQLSYKEFASDTIYPRLRQVDWGNDELVISKVSVMDIRQAGQDMVVELMDEESGDTLVGFMPADAVNFTDDAVAMFIAYQVYAEQDGVKRVRIYGTLPPDEFKRINTVKLQPQVQNNGVKVEVESVVI